MDDMSAFEGFVRANWPELMAISLALTHDRYQAEDLLQNALVNALPRWSGIRPDGAMPYLRTCLVNAQISGWRRVGRRESPVAQFDEWAGPSPYAATDDRLELVARLRNLPTRQRAVLVLRYLCDLSDAEVGATLGIGQAAVRSNAHRGLARLRESGSRPVDTGPDPVRLIGEC
jgi:RNA polymerase sigma-70 factor (sigma-E family)